LRARSTFDADHVETRHLCLTSGGPGCESQINAFVSQYARVRIQLTCQLHASVAGAIYVPLPFKNELIRRHRIGLMLRRVSTGHNREDGRGHFAGF